MTRIEAIMSEKTYFNLFPLMFLMISHISVFKGNLIFLPECVNYFLSECIIGISVFLTSGTTEQKILQWLDLFHCNGLLAKVTGNCKWIMKRKPKQGVTKVIFSSIARGVGVLF